jgi:NAD(P)-dependent dehydrogenase (short-subunit alcohol dehydrogenase family)
MSIDLSNRVAIVTGAGAGLGAAHAVALARRGARVVVADLDGDAAAAVCAQILVNNAGILRDRTFAKMDLDDFRVVLEVHLMGSANCTKAVWDTMRAQTYGRVVFTTSSSGLYGNFGQANYSAAKMALVGLMQTLALEGERSGIRVNCLAPSAATGMTDGLYSPEMLAGLDPSLVSPAVVALASEDAPTRTILLAGAGAFEAAHVTMTTGLFLGEGEDTADTLLARLGEVTARGGEAVPIRGEEQYRYEMDRRSAALEVDAEG